MNELLKTGQIISVVPQDFKNSNKGEIVQILDKFFTLKMLYEPEGILPKKIMEFYSTTKNGTLYFSSPIIKIDEGLVVVSMPKKHRYLQRRAFTRVKYKQETQLTLNKINYNATSIDLSAGGIKIISDKKMDLDEEYNLNLNILNNNIQCKYQPIKIEKSDDKHYTLAGRFKNLSRTDKMKLIQFCIRKDIENKNR